MIAAAMLDHEPLRWAAFHNQLRGGSVAVGSVRCDFEFCFRLWRLVSDVDYVARSPMVFVPAWSCFFVLAWATMGLKRKKQAEQAAQKQKKTNAIGSSAFEA